MLYAERGGGEQEGILNPPLWSIKGLEQGGVKSKVDLVKAVAESTLLEIIDRELRRVKCSCDCALRMWIREHSVLMRHALSD